jgi:hypothetical protein
MKEKSGGDKWQGEKKERGPRKYRNDGGRNDGGSGYKKKKSFGKSMF